MINLKKINWKEGFGTAILGSVMILVAFVMTLMVFQQLIVYDTAAKAQIVSDTISDGAAVAAALPMDVDETKADNMIAQLLEENEKYSGNTEYTLTTSYFTKDLSRNGYKDNILTVELNAESPKIVTAGSLSDVFAKNVISKVKIFSLVPEHVDLGLAGEEISRALSEVPINSPQYNAIIESMTYYGWRYSQPQRWVEGARDCSSFVLSCYRDYTDIFDANPYGYTQTIWNDAKAAGLLYEVNAADLDTGAFSAANLQVGDILLWHGSWAEGLGRDPEGLGHTGIYLGISTIDGMPKIIHASSSAGGVTVSNLTGMHSGSGQLLGVVRIPTSNQ